NRKGGACLHAFVFLPFLHERRCDMSKLLGLALGIVVLSSACAEQAFACHRCHHWRRHCCASTGAAPACAVMNTGCNSCGATVAAPAAPMPPAGEAPPAPSAQMPRATRSFSVAPGQPVLMQPPAMAARPRMIDPFTAFELRNNRSPYTR